VAIANGYTTLADLKARLGITDTSDDAALELAIESASRTIDGFCRRRFFTTTSDETRYFTAGASDVLFPGDVVSVTSLKTDEDSNGTYEVTWAANTDYVLEPFNAALDGRPYTLIRRHPLGSYLFPTAIRAVQIVGKFGFPAVPTAVKEACEIQAAEFFKRLTEGPQPDLTFEGAPQRPGPSRYLERSAQLHVEQYRRVLMR